MIPYEVIKDNISAITMIKCCFCNKMFKTTQEHEQHLCPKEKSFSEECLSCKKPYKDHTKSQNENSPGEGVNFLFSIVYFSTVLAMVQAPISFLLLHGVNELLWRYPYLYYGLRILLFAITNYFKLKHALSF